MREKKAFKRALSFLMSLVVAFTTFTSDYTLAVAADSNTQDEYPSTVMTGDNNLSVIKSAEKTTDGKIKITFSVTAQKSEEVVHEKKPVYTDVVFVMDLSTSMEGKPIKSAKEAAVNFSNTLLTGDAKDYVKVGLVTFGNNGSTKVNLTTNQTTFATGVNTLSVGKNTGTNIQAGIHEAAKLLDGDTRTDVNKIIVLLSDGEPSFCYKYSSDSNIDITYPGWENGRIVNLKGKLCNTKDYLYADDYLYGTGNYDTNTGTQDSNISRITVSEAYYAKQKGYQIYTIGYNLDDHNFAKAVMEAVASGSDYYYDAASSGKNNPVSNIATSISVDIKKNILLAQSPSIEDTFPSYMHVDANTVSARVKELGSTQWKPATGDRVPSVSQKGDKVTWFMANAEEGELTIYATIDYDKMYNNNPYKMEDFAGVNGGMAKVNDSVTVTYYDKEKTEKKLTGISSANNNVPYQNFKTYAYTVNYVVDGVSKGTETKYAYPGKKDIHIDHIKDYRENKDKFETPSIEGLNGYSTDLTGYKFTMGESDKNITIKYTTKKYTVTFIDKDKNVIDKKEDVIYGTKIDDVRSSKKASDYVDSNHHRYVFKDWNYQGVRTITQDRTFSATYRDSGVAKYTVTFMAWNVSTGEYEQYGDVQNVEYNNKAKKPSKNPNYYVPSEAGIERYEFKNWKLDGATSAFNFDTKITSDTVLYADYTPVLKEYTVNYIGLDGKVCAYDTVKHGEVIKDIQYPATAQNPYKDVQNNKYIAFLNWDTEVVSKKASEDMCNEKGVIIVNPVSEENILYYTVTWVDRDDVTLYSDDKVEYLSNAEYKGRALSTEQDERHVYTFTGWDYADKNGIVNNVTSNITVKAQYSSTDRLYTYTFNYRDVSNNEKTYTYNDVKYDDTREIPVDCAKNIVVKDAEGNETSYELSTWTDETFRTGIHETTSTTAVYSGTTTHTVTFVKDDEVLGTKTVVDGESIGSVTYDTSKIDLINVYEFIGWEDANNQLINLGDTKIYESLTLHASYAETPIQYKLPVTIYGLNSAVITDSEFTNEAGFNGNVSYDVKLDELNQNSAIRYEFDHIEFMNNTLTSSPFSTQITEDTIGERVYVYLKEAPKYRVYFHNAVRTEKENGLGYSFSTEEEPTDTTRIGMSDGVYAGQVPTYSTEINTPEDAVAIKYTYSFKNWIDKDGNQFDVTAPISGNVDVYASYNEEIHSYNVRFIDSLDPENYPVDVSANYGDIISRDNPRTPDDTESTDYLGGDYWNYDFSNEITSDTEITAIHPSKPMQYTVHFFDVEGNEIGTVTQNYGTEVNEITNYNRNYSDRRFEYSFVNWKYYDYSTREKSDTEVTFPITELASDYYVIADYVSNEKVVVVRLHDENSDDVIETLTTTWNELSNGFDADTNAAKRIGDDAATNKSDWEYTYTFVGWTDCTGNFVNITGLTESIDVYALYEKSKNQYHVTYYKEDGETVWNTSDYFAAGEPVNIIAGDYVPYKSPSDDGQFEYTFAGWVDMDDKDKPIGLSISSIQRDYHLKATYTSSICHYTVTYLDEDGSEWDTCTDVSYGEAVDDVQRPSENPTKSSVSDNDGYVTDYTFAGWDFGNVTTIESDTNAYATYSWVKYPTDPEATIDEIITITGKEETGNVFTNDSSIPEGTERVAKEVTNARLYDAENNEIGTYSVSSNGDYTVTFTAPVENGYTIDVEYVLKGTKTLSNGSTEDYNSEKLTSSIIAYVCDAKAITLEDKTGAYNGQNQYLEIPSNVDDFKEVKYSYNGQSYDEMPGFKDAGEYTVTVTGEYEFKGMSFNVSDDAVLTINKADIKVSLAKDLTMVADEFPKEPEYDPTVTGIVDGDKELVNLTYTCELADAAKASNGRYNIGQFDVEIINASISAAAAKNYNLTTENGLLTITAPKGDSKANFYVVIPGALKNLSKEPAGQSLTVVNQSDSNYFSTGKQFGFVYSFSPYKSVAEYFGSHLKHDGDKVELTVDNNFSADELANVNIEYTYQTKNEYGWVLNTYRLKDIDWYVIKDYSALAANDEKVSNWHVDGYAGTIELQAKTFAGKTFTHTYNGNNRANEVRKEITDYIKGQNNYLFGTGSYEIVKLDVQDIKDANTYTVTATVRYADGIDETIDPTFDVEFKEIVNKLTVSIPSVNETKTYDGLGFSKEYSFKTTARDTIKYSASTNEVNAGKYNLKISVNESEYPNYTIKKDQTYKLTINKKDITVTVADATKTYGDWDPKFEVKEINGLISGDEAKADTLKKAISLSRAFGENVGKYNIFVNYANLKNYNISKVNEGKLTITPATLTVKVKNASKVYGDKNPSKYDVELSGFKFYDGYAYDLFKKAIVVDNTNTNANAGTYENVLAVNVRKTNMNLSNYKVTEESCTPADFTIKKANLWVDVKSASKTYGDDDPEFNYILTGLKNGDTKASIGEIEIVRTNVGVENAGQYWNVLVVREGTELQNYNIFSDKAHLTIYPKAIDLKEVNPDGFDDVKIYDGEGYVKTVSANGVNDEVVSIKLSTDKKDASETPYLLSAKVVDNANYVLNRSHYTLTINKRPITLESGSASKVYDGTPLTNNDVTVSGNGFVEGEGATYENFASITNFGSVENKFDVSFNENTKESNYDVTYVYGKLDVAKRHVDVYANDASKTQGDSDPAFTVSVSNAIEAVSAFAWRINGNEAPGEYPIFITLGEPVNANYDIAVHEGTFTIYASEVVPGPIPGPTPGPTPTTVTPVPPTPEVVEEVLPEPEEVEVVEEAVPEAEAPAEVVEIPEEEVPEAVASHCFIHWIILGITVLYALYAVLRMVQYKNENEDEEKQAENN